MKEYKYILDKKGNPKVCKDVLKWGKWFGETNRIIKQDTIGKYFVSTVFLAMDMNFFGKRKPVLWETMVFKKLTQREADKKNLSYRKAFAMMNKGAPAGKKLKYRDLYSKGSKEEAEGFDMKRYTSREAAVRGHNEMVKLVTKTIKK